MTKPTILFIANVNSTFVRRDIEGLKQHYNVKNLIVEQPKKFFSFLLVQTKIVFFLFSNLRKSKIVFCWFADYHSFFPSLISRLSGRQFYLVEGGYDTTYISSLDYGVFSNWLRTFMSSYAIKHATRNLPVSEFLSKELKNRFGSELSIKVIPTGYDDRQYFSKEKDDFIITVAGVSSEKRLLIKGVHRVVDLARIMPDQKFVIVGIAKELRDDINPPPNVHITEMLNNVEVSAWLSKAPVYVQFSIREGLPNSVFEAMLSECCVVGIKHSGLKEAINGAGYLLEQWDPEKAKSIVENAIENVDMGKRARKYVIDNFSMQRRIDLLLNLLENSHD